MSDPPSTPPPTDPSVRAPGAGPGALPASTSLLLWRRSWWRAPTAAQAVLDVVLEVVQITCVVVLTGAVGNPDQTWGLFFWVVFLPLVIAFTVVRTRSEARRDREGWLDLARLEGASPQELDAAERVVRAGAAPSSAGEAVLALRWSATAEHTHGRLMATWVLAAGLVIAVALRPLFGGWWSPSWVSSWVTAGVTVVVALVVQRQWRRGLRRHQERLRALLAQSAAPSPQ